MIETVRFVVKVDVQIMIVSQSHGVRGISSDRTLLIHTEGMSEHGSMPG